MHLTPENRLSLAVFLEYCAMGVFLPLAPIYFLREHNIALSATGLAMAIAGLLASAIAILCGKITDAFPPTNILFILLSATAVAVPVLFITSSIELVTASLTPVLLFERLAFGARGALMKQIAPPDGQVRLRARLRVSTNGGILAGSGLFALALSMPEGPTTWIILSAVSAMLFSSAFVTRSITPVHAQDPALSRSNNHAVPHAQRPHKNARYLLLSIAAALIYLHVAFVDFAVPAYVLQETRLPPSLSAAAIVINVCGILALQIPVAAWSERHMPPVRGGCLSAALLIGSFILLLGAQATSKPKATFALIGCIVLYTGAELLLAPLLWAASFECAPSERQGEYQTFFGGFQAVGAQASTAVLGMAILRDNDSLLFPALLLVLFTGCVAVGGILAACRHDAHEEKY